VKSKEEFGMKQLANKASRLCLLPASRWSFLVVWLVDSCCSHLEHRASVKRFVSPQFLNLTHPVGLLGRVISPSEGRYLTQTQNKHKQTNMPRVGFEPTIPSFERAKTVHAVDRAATVIGGLLLCLLLNNDDGGNIFHPNVG
jgi:hypothetical protein